MSGNKENEGIRKAKNFAKLSAEDWLELIRSINAGIPEDIHSTVQQVMRESYEESQKDLQYFAAKVRHINNIKKAIREELKKVRRVLGINSAKGGCSHRNDPVEPYAPRCFKSCLALDEDCKPTIVVGEGEPLNTWGELEDYIDELEESLATAGQDVQLANMDLQNILQKMQQILQTISNVSKMMHDTAMAVIRNIG